MSAASTTSVSSLTSYKTVTPAQIESAANATGTPNWVIASVYKSGYVGDVMALAQRLKYWFNATGGTGWERALAGWHLNTPAGAVNKAALRYAQGVIKGGESVPSSLVGSMSIRSAASLAAVEVGGFLLGGVGPVSAAAADAGAAADAAATDAASGSAAGTAARTAKSLATDAGTLGVVVGLEQWVSGNVLKALVYIVCLALGMGLIVAGARDLAAKRVGR